jgi:hypothetical protein
MSSLDLYMEQARACKRAAELSSDPILAAQLCEEHQMWVALARQSAAIDGLAALIARLDDCEDPGPSTTLARPGRRTP